MKYEVYGREESELRLFNRLEKFFNRKGFMYLPVFYIIWYMSFWDC